MTSEKHLPPLSNAETSAFCSQMAMILRSGISSIEGISILLEDSTDSGETELLQQINQTLLETGRLDQALDATGAFPSYMVQMTRLGEESGQLDNVMNSLALYYEKEASLSQSIKNAVTYPFLMILMMILVILVLLTKVMPVFQQVFRQLGTEMSGLSLAVLNLGMFLNRHTAVCIAVLLLLAFGFLALFKTKGGHNILRRISRSFPGMRALYQRMAARRFASGMALTLSSGLPPLECLRLSQGLIEDPDFSAQLQQCESAVDEGENLCDTLLNHHIFSGLYAKMASIASRSGVLDEVMEKIAVQYEEDIDTRLSQFLGAIEPTLVIILSVIVGIILLSVMLPLISIMAGL